MTGFKEGVHRAAADRRPAQDRAAEERRLPPSPWDVPSPLPPSASPSDVTRDLETKIVAAERLPLLSRTHLADEAQIAPTAPLLAPSRRHNRWVQIAAVAAVAAAIAAARAGLFSGPPADGTLVGTVAANEVVVSSKLAGRLERLSVTEGDVVRRGQVVGTLDRQELQAERRDHAARITQLEARLVQTREVITLESDRVSGRSAVLRATAQAAVSERARAEAELAQRRNDLDRAQSLLASGLVARQETERLETEVLAADARLKAADEQVRSAQAEVALSDANGRQVVVASQDTAQVQAQLAQARAQLAQVDARLADSQLRAPLGGTVALRVAREGEVVRAGDPIVTIIDLDDVWVRAQVEETRVGSLRLGQSLTVRLASGIEREGRVTFIAPEADFATQRDASREQRDVRTFGFKIALPNADRVIHPGMTAYVVLPAAAGTTAATTTTAGG